MKKYFFLFIPLLILACSEEKQPEVVAIEETEVTEKTGYFFEYRYVSVEQGIVLRKEPTIASVKLASIPFNSEVILLREASEIEVIQGLEGRWVYIEWEGKRGFVFSGFLSKNKYLSIVQRDGSLVTRQYEIDDQLIEVAVDYAGNIAGFRGSMEIDPTRLPLRYLLITGIPGPYMGDVIDSNKKEPAIEIVDFIFYNTLLIYNLPDMETPFTVVFETPDGKTIKQECRTIDSEQVIAAKDKEKILGYIYLKDEMTEQEFENPVIALDLGFYPCMPQGLWKIQVILNDNSILPLTTTFNVSTPGPVALPHKIDNPFDYGVSGLFNVGVEVFIYGYGQEPDSEIIIAFYRLAETAELSQDYYGILVPQCACRVQTNTQGGYEFILKIGNDMKKDSYYIFAGDEIKESNEPVFIMPGFTVH